MKFTPLFIIMMLLSFAHAQGGGGSLKIEITKSSVVINGQSIHIDDFDKGMHQFEGATEVLPFPNPSDDERSNLKSFPISFTQYNRTYNSIYIWLSHPRFEDVDIEHYAFTASQKTSARQFENILYEAKIKYSKYEYEWDPKGSCRIDSSLSGHLIVQASFKDYKLSDIEIRLRKVPSPDPVPDKFSNKKRVQCTLFSEEDDLLIYSTETAKIEIRKSDLRELLNEIIDGNPSKVDSIKSQLKDRHDWAKQKRIALFSHSSKYQYI